MQARLMARCSQQGGPRQVSPFSPFLTLSTHGASLAMQTVSARQGPCEGLSRVPHPVAESSLEHPAGRWPRLNHSVPAVPSLSPAGPVLAGCASVTGLPLPASAPSDRQGRWLRQGQAARLDR